MKAWRDSATLILAARRGQKYRETLSGAAFRYDYDLLNLKRHRNATFMPGSYVFPGGVVEPSDADPKWNGLFSAFGLDDDSFSPLLVKRATRPRIFGARRHELPREISLRITAIRETFEECGILMCRQKAERGASKEWAECIAPDDLRNWQNKVHDDATQFYGMCEGLGCYPDIWALHEWSNWLTPTFMPKRFDAIFYIACAPSRPAAEYESGEMEHLLWEEPGALLCPSNDYDLPPPQYYEIGRIAKFESIDNLLDFALARSKMGVRLTLPVKVQLSDGSAHVLPGDSMYPDRVSLTDKQVLDRRPMTIEEFRQISPVKNRMEYFSLDVKTLTVDEFISEDGHLSPLSVETVQHKTPKGR